MHLQQLSVCTAGLLVVGGGTSSLNVLTPFKTAPESPCNLEMCPVVPALTEAATEGVCGLGTLQQGCWHRAWLVVSVPPLWRQWQSWAAVIGQPQVMWSRPHVPVLSVVCSGLLSVWHELRRLCFHHCSLDSLVLIVSIRCQDCLDSCRTHVEYLLLSGVGIVTLWQWLVTVTVTVTSLAAFALTSLHTDYSG